MKKITNLFKFNMNAKELFPYYVNKIYKYINADHIFFFFIFGMLLNTSLVRFLTVNNYFEIKPMVGDLVVILLIGAVSFLIKQRTKRFTYSFKG